MTNIYNFNNRLERLWECYLDRDIDKTRYELEKQKYLEQKKDLIARAEKYAYISNELKDNVGKALDFVANLSNLMKIASPDEKNMLLKKLLTNCVLDGEVLKYEIQAPFDKLLACSNYKKWKDTLIYRNFHRLYAFLEKNHPKILEEFLATSPEELDAIVAKLFSPR